MATKRTTLQIESKGGEKVASDLKKIGAIGEKSGKKIETGTKKASKGLKAVDAAVASTNRSMRSLASNLGPVGAGLSKLGVLGLAAAGGAVAAGGLFALTKRAAESANALLDQSIAIGISVEALQEWQFVAQQSGVQADIFSGLMLKLSKRLGDIGTSGTGPLVGFLEKFDQGLLDSLRSTSNFDEQLGLVINRLGQLSQATERASVADALFSESGRNVGLVALQGAERIEELRQRLRDLGGVISEDATRNAKELTDTISELSSAVSGNLNNALLQLSPTMKDMAESLVDLVPGFVAWVDSFKDLENRSLGSLAMEAAELRKELEGLQAGQPGGVLGLLGDATGLDIKLPQVLQRGEIKATEEQLKKVNDQLIESVRIRAIEIEQNEERQVAVAKLRAEEEAASEAVKKALEADKKRAEAAKKFSTERKRALSDIQKLQDKAERAGLKGLQLLELERDKELDKQLARHERGLINEQEYTDARLAIEKEFQAEKEGIAVKATKEATKEVKKEAETQASVFVAPFSTAASNIQSSFADTFTDIYRGSVTNFEDLADSIKDIMARLAGEITALMVIRPVIAGVGSAFAGSAGAGLAGGAAGGVAGGTATAGGAGGLGAWLATGAGSNALAGAIGIGAGVAGYYAGNQLSSIIGLNQNKGGNFGGLVGGIAGGAFFGPGGAALGALGGNLLGNFIGNGFGFGGGNDKQKFGFGTGVGGVQTPFGGLAVTASQNVDSSSIIQSLKGIDESIAALLSSEQIGRVRSDLAGTGQFFSVKGFDNESFDVVKTRLVRIIDAVAENTVASGLLNSIGRDPGNIDKLVQSAQSIVGLISAFQDEGQDLNQAEQAVEALNAQFDQLSDSAIKLGFSIADVEQKRQDAIADLTTDFNRSIRDQILAIEDPLTASLENVERVAEDRLANAKTLGADLVAVERLTALEREKILSQTVGSFSQANASISSFLQSLKITGAGGLSSGSQASNASALFDSLLGSARSDPGARSDLAAILPQLVDAKREELGSSSAFFEFTSFLDRTLTNLVDQGDTVSTLNDIGAAITTGDNAVVNTLQQENLLLRNEIAGLRSDINLLLPSSNVYQSSSL